MPVIIFIVSALILIWKLTQTRFDRSIFAVGGNRDAARLAGIRVRHVEFMTYGLAGMFAALAGILYASRSDAANPAADENWLMGSITAAIRVGTSLRGGQGSIVGTILGALLLAVLCQRDRVNERLGLLAARDRRLRRSGGGLSGSYAPPRLGG